MTSDSIPDKLILATAYLPPPEYFFHAKSNEELLIEREENYIKQTFRNRCYILSPGGVLMLSVPVFLGSFHKTPVKDIRIDYSKRWQPVHIGAIKAGYASSPFFLYYWDPLEKIILSNKTFLLDLNMELLECLMNMMKIKISISFTSEFMPVVNKLTDKRYSISPKRKSHYKVKRYIQVFNSPDVFTEGLSIIDLIFNTGPDARGCI